ncbi:MAG: hypothetical protein U1E46_17530 [Hyphomicrobiales bacterium]
MASGAMPAHANPFIYKFYNGSAGYVGPFDGAGTAYQLSKDATTDVVQPGSSPDLKPGADYVGSTAIYGTGNKPTLTATAGSNLVVQDLSPDFAGMGVYAGTGAWGVDEIGGSEILRFSFDRTVTLAGVATLFAPLHDESNFGAAPATPSSNKKVQTSKNGKIKAGSSFNAKRKSVTRSLGKASKAPSPPPAFPPVTLKDGVTFQMSVDGGAWQNVSFADANNMLLNFVGQVFQFRQASGMPDFYVGALLGHAPIPGAVWLFGTGLAGIGYIGRRRRLPARAA